MSLFTDSELVFTRNAKDNTYMGGGYVLKSEFMEGGAPPIVNIKMNGGGGSDGGDGNNRIKSRKVGRSTNKVSSLLFDRTRAVPAGLFLMNNQKSDAQSVYDDSRINSVLNDNSDGSSSSSSGDDSSSSGGSSSDDSSSAGGNHRRRRRQSAVVPETLYDTLLKMLSPDADKRRYWANGAKTQRQRRNNNKNHTRKNKIN
jgi:hypothetical protein